MRTLDIDPIGNVVVRKSVRAKRVIIKIDHQNQPVVIIPKYLPYAVGLDFAKKNISWIAKHLQKNSNNNLKNEMKIGKKHQLFFNPEPNTNLKSRVQNSTIVITYPANISYLDQKVQKEAVKAATRAIKKEADDVLPRYIYNLAAKYGYNYKSISIKNMRSRWGSCSSEGVINLNIWLLQLPDELINYVCCHELTHLNHPHHQKAFWEELESMIPDYKILRKKLKEYSPSLNI